MSNNLLEHLLSSRDSICGNKLRISILQADCIELEKGSPERKEVEKEITKLARENNSTWSKLPHEIDSVQALSIYIDKVIERDKQPNQQVDFEDRYKSPPEFDQKQPEQQQEKQPTHHIVESQQYRQINFEGRYKSSPELDQKQSEQQQEKQPTHHIAEPQQHRPVNFEDRYRHHVPRQQRSNREHNFEQDKNTSWEK